VIYSVYTVTPNHISKIYKITHVSLLLRLILDCKLFSLKFGKPFILNRVEKQTMFWLYCSEKSDLFVLFPDFLFSYCTVSTVYMFKITYKCVLLMLHCKKQFEPINKYLMNTYGNINLRDRSKKRLQTK